MSPWETERDAVLIRLGAAKDAHTRVLALDELLGLAASAPAELKPGLASELPAWLADPDGGVRAAALGLAAEVLPVAEATPILGERLGDPDVRVRVEAASLLADLARPELRGSLARALEDEAFEVRFEAARGMASLRHAAGLDVLLTALEDGDWRYRALGALGELADPRSIPAVRKVFGRWFLNAFERARAATVLAILGEADAGAYLRKRLKKRWSPDRAIVAEMIGEAKVEGARELLERMVKNPKEPVRGAAARGLGRLGGAGVLEVLGAVLDEAGLEPDYRLDVLEGLCLLRTEKAHARVREVLSSMEWSDAKADLEAWLRECSRDMRDA